LRVAKVKGGAVAVSGEVFQHVLHVSCPTVHIWGGRRGRC
jgi:hypothetical protein